MIVKDYMTRHPLMVEPTMPIIEAQKYMGENNVRHLPVVGEGKRLLGLVTRQTLLLEPSRLGSLNMWEIARYLSGLTVKDVMVKAQDVITIDSNITIEEAACVMVEKKIGCLPVVEEGIVVGILTEADLLAHLTDMMASRTPGVRVTIRMPNFKPGELARLVAAIAAQGWPIEALGGSAAPKDPDKWDAVVKLRVPKEQVIAVLGKVEGQEIIDAREV
jgi:acetoin utilization protein AcuB